MFRLLSAAATARARAAFGELASTLCAGWLMSMGWLIWCIAVAVFDDGGASVVSVVVLLVLARADEAAHTSRPYPVSDGPKLGKAEGRHSRLRPSRKNA